MQAVNTDKAPAALGPYSQAIIIPEQNLVYTAGQLGLDPQTGDFAGTDITTQTRQALKNLQAVLAAANTSLAAAVKTTVFLHDMNDFAAMNAVYAEFFSEPFPARSAIQAARLPKDALVEIEVVAIRKA